MKVALLDIPGARFGPYWAAFLKELGLDLAQPQLSAQAAYALGKESLPGEPAQVQLALGRLLELGRIDAAVLPRSRPVGQDAWGSALSDLLPRRIGGLPTLLPVPDGGPELSSAATELGQKLTRNPALVRLALDKVKPLAQAPRRAAPALSAASQLTVAVIGPDAALLEPLFIQPLLERLSALGLYPVLSSDLPRDQVSERGARFTTPHGKALEVGETDLHGAQSWLEGKSAVRGLLYVAPARDAATLGALQRLSAKAHKPTLVLELEPEVQWPTLDAFAARLGAAASARLVPALAQDITQEERS